MSYSLGTNQLSLLQDAYDDAVINRTGEGKYARVYELLFSMLSKDALGTPIISDIDAATLDYDVWKTTGLSGVAVSGWQMVDSGFDPSAWVFLKGVSDVNWGRINPDHPGGTNYSNFIRNYSIAQYEIRFGTPATESQVQQTSDQIADEIINDILDNYGLIPNIDNIAERDAAGAAVTLFGSGVNIAGWAGNPFLVPVGHTSSYARNILNLDSDDYGDSYDALSVLAAAKTAAVNTGLGSSLSLGLNLLFSIIPESHPDGFEDLVEG